MLLSSKKVGVDLLLDMLFMQPVLQSHDKPFHERMYDLALSVNKVTSTFSAVVTGVGVWGLTILRQLTNVYFLSVKASFVSNHSLRVWNRLASRISDYTSRTLKTNV